MTVAAEVVWYLGLTCTAICFVLFMSEVDGQYNRLSFFFGGLVSAVVAIAVAVGATLMV